MQFRQFFFLLSCSLMLLFVSTNLAAQELKTNDDGDKIIVYPDGSWRYFDEDMDEQQSYNVNKMMSKGDDLTALEDKERMRIRKLAKKERDIALLKKITLDEAIIAKAFLETDIADAEDGGVASEEIFKMQQELEKHRRKELLARVEYETAKDKADAYEKLIHMKPAKRAKRLAKLEGTYEKPKSKIASVISKPKLKGSTAYGNSDAVKVDQPVETIEPELTAPIADNSNSIPADDTVVSVLGVTEEPALEDKQKTAVYGFDQTSIRNNDKVFRQYNAQEDVMVNPPPPPCKLAFDGIDEFNNRRRRDVERNILFSHTSDKMRSYLKGKEYLTCYGNITSIAGGYRVLWLEVHINSTMAQREFGSLEKGSMLYIKFLDGTSVKLINKKEDLGTLNTLNKSTVFKSQYPIGAGAEKDLTKKEIDEIRIVWSTGYEDYQVYDVDFFIDQFKCLNEL